ncbi:MAG: N-formylglutamate amidohydrolase [Alphaproteobacteria bacterium]|nr:N-formylglutamate amidohydrolase [Alphaproteobacteria bacterium]
MSEKKLDFRIDYKKIKIFEEYNAKDLKFPIVLSSPHAGTLFPEEFLNNSCLSKEELRTSEDCFVSEIVKEASDAGIPLISMNIPRTFVDVNRDKVELDEGMFFDAPNQSSAISRRCRVGLGIIHRVIYPNKNIYEGKLSYKECMDRLKYVYDPYHKQLKKLVDRCVRKFGFCLLIDCHSMPSMICNIMNDDKPLDFCLCTLFDESCPTQMSEFLSRALEDRQYRVEFNRPFAGAYIAFNYCQPRKNIYTLQLEINRGLYMDEKLLKKKSDFQSVSHNICQSILELGNFLLDLKK